jgi:uncharacterized protein YceH (UPF0502 family)
MSMPDETPHFPPRESAPSSAELAQASAASSERDTGQAPAEGAAPKWPSSGGLTGRQRRVFGVLIEKAKTTPDAYPMTINGLVAGCNQKSNRDPQMNLSADDVEQVLEELRALGAVTEVQGSGRVPKYRHHAYEWLGVEKVELAVMTELLLRGEQTLGELRARASRMEPIADLGAVKAVVDSLIAKGLMMEVTRPGRGQIVSHNLYKEKELAEVKTRFAGHAPAHEYDEGASAPLVTGTAGAAVAAKTGARVTPPGVTADQFAELSVEVAELRAEIARLKDELRGMEGKLQAVMS